MCGIAGILHHDDRPVELRSVQRMAAQLRHRGPDSTGATVEGPVGLGHTRLSIIDLAGGIQPMATRDGSVQVTFNGEIFNYLELRERLIGLGHTFATRSDTEVILHAYRQWGDRCVEHFNGQWAFAVWDRRRRRLFLSRDRMGIRPLYHASLPGRFLFASEVKALAADPQVRLCLDPQGINQVFTYWTTLAPRTVFEGIQELPPAHCMSVERGRVHCWRYWQFLYDPDPSLTEQQAAEGLIELLSDSVRLRLRSDVPVGAYLSGGLDSSVTAALIRQITDTPLETFSVAFDDADYDESRFQRIMVERLGTRHHELRCSYEDIGAALADAVFHAERPLLRTAPVPLYLLARRVRQQGYKVVVTGEGADEILGGYDLFKEAKVRRFWAAQPDSRLRRLLLKKLYPYMPNLQAQSPAYLEAFFHVAADDLHNPFFSHLPRWRLGSQLKRFLSEPYARADRSGEPYDDCRRLLAADFDSWHPFAQAQYLESAVLLPGYILSSQGDRMAMAHGIEGRFPFLDYRLAEFAGRLPARWKMKGLCEKYLLKRAAGSLVPEEIVRRPKQPYRAPEAVAFFGTPEHPLRNACAEQMLSASEVESCGVFEPKAVEHLVRKARSGRTIGAKDNMALVGILSTQILVDRLIRNFRPAADDWQPARIPAGPAPVLPSLPREIVTQFTETRDQPEPTISTEW
ncbi:MAG: asparagine synthase (glutamine-hydrolyzing) [Thermoguttaceae bacterium]